MLISLKDAIENILYKIDTVRAENTIKKKENQRQQYLKIVEKVYKQLTDTYIE